MHPSLVGPVDVGPLSDGTGFVVADDGPGIPEGARDTVLEWGDGTGVGLGNVLPVADRHGWTVQVGESRECGARVAVYDGA